MKDKNYLTAIYYTVTIILSSSLILGLIVLLDWPLSAEIPLAITLFIQLIYISRILHMNLIDMKVFSIEELVAKMKIVLLENDNKEEATYYNHRSAQ